ncbi:SDR family oxidoreductase [Roseomonas terrae]|jgi:NAD(P)-dependent dehydrogenase (short-subunit alcohol dehydrogenase family)|uniref:SDR family oxidoreductase n=2 Tax=Neoroseomonas terrae TaxID=424799 RepID=A0ABS5EC49_9PROT|nr:SDR family oxidoreductase [Neoroseomonas terrae]MBR0648594.1 SDR family oxidoreductase [Neoroseomonas terrae]
MVLDGGSQPPRLVVVTGGSRGIGLAVTRRLAEDGYRIVVGCRHEEETSKVLAGVRDGNGTAAAIRLDVADQRSIDEFFSAVQDRFGPIHALVNNAGITGPLGRFVEADLSWVRRVAEVNMLGTMGCAKAALLHFAATPGSGRSIVNISSVAAQTGSPGEYVHYAATKAAIEAFTIGLAREVAKEGIRINAVAPGTIATGIHAMAGDPDRPQRVAQRVPMGRVGRPEEIANAVAWLISPASSYVTGAVLRVTGGL